MADVISTLRVDPAPTPVIEPVQNTPAPVTPPVAPPEPAKPATPEPKEGAAWAAIKAQERKLQTQRESIKAEREKAQAELKAEREAQAADIQAAKDYAAAKANAKRVPLKALEALGLTYEDLTQAMLNGGTTSPELIAQDVDSKLSALEKKLLADREAEKAAAKAEREASEKAIIENFHKQTVEWVKQPAQAEKYELLVAYGQEDQVGPYIQLKWENEGKEVTREQAAQELETYLQTEAEKLTKTKWFQSKFQSTGKPAAAKPATDPKTVAPTESSEAVPEEDQEILERMRTSLNNSMTRRTAPAPDDSFEARLKAAKAAFETP
jgi:hypothetical protein